MDTFSNRLDPKKFQYTNKIWNELELNKAWSIGLVSKLITQRNFRSKEEWKEYYFESGKERLKIVNDREFVSKAILNQRIQPKVKLNHQYMTTNLNYGRTKEELKYKGFILYNAIIEQGNPLKITLNECEYSVMFRVIGETWNGIIKREQNTIAQLKNVLSDIKGIIFEKTSGTRDSAYEVDYDVYFNNKIICGLQIKPKSYINFDDSNLKKLNESKNQKYKEKYNAEVLYVYSSIKGEIYNKEIINKIRNLVK